MWWWCYCIFSSACCVILQLLSLILIVLVKSFAVAFSLWRERLKSLSLVPQGTGLWGKPWDQLLDNWFAHQSHHHNAFTIPRCTNKSLTRLCRNPKLLDPSNFIMSNFAKDVTIPAIVEPSFDTNCCCRTQQWWIIWNRKEKEIKRESRHKFNVVWQCAYVRRRVRLYFFIQWFKVTT